jgi:surface polysaccharide O-acyltransferase-like enzyme
MAEPKQSENLPAQNLQPKIGLPIPVDLIRSVAIFLVILLHISIEPIVAPPQLITTAWWASDFFNSIARPCVPLFVMLTGYLLLQPSKVNEPLKVFFKKRFARIGLPFIFWGAIFFVWLILFDNVNFSLDYLVLSMLQGPYVTFWYLYMLIGLYLLTPILRVLVAYASDNVMKLLLVVWFIGSGLVPLGYVFGYSLNSNVFVLPGWIGYFLLGAYLPKMKIKPRRWRLFALLAVGFAWTMIASAMMQISPGPELYYFYDYLTANVIVASVALFLLLTSVSAASFEKMPSSAKRLIHTISGVTLPVYLFHMLLVEAFEKGLFGFTLNIMSLNPLIMTPLLRQ